MAEVPGLDRKINAWLYRHDRPGLQFSSRKSMHLPRSGLKTRSSARFVHVRAFNSSSLAYPGNLHVTCVTGASRRSGRWTTTWSCTRERSRSSASGPAAIILSSQPLPWRTTTGLTQVWNAFLPGAVGAGRGPDGEGRKGASAPLPVRKTASFLEGACLRFQSSPRSGGSRGRAMDWNWGFDIIRVIWAAGMIIQTQLVASVK